MLSASQLLFATALVVCFVSAHSYCGVTPPVWRNENMTCPARAVCADVFEHVRDWYNGTRCEERRTLHNCKCQGNTVCPYNNDAHKIYASKKHTRYTCEPTCTLPYCSNVPRQLVRNRMVPPTAVTAEQNSAQFGGRTYYRIDCRCPRHHNPRQQRGRFRSVKTYSHRYDFRLHQYSTLYICDAQGSEGRLPDPCEN
ncbi:uncharacterized protein LOC101853874 [Aplysia californica]|uniref:Uncharacterized protein LOC101853874 n=1 Tax=Aplysia californica TaxID=6500 RepID=A0ABM0JY42_APLCA|nr:uncharacterized protein LOC101853874 [Aplysia californica]